MTPELAPLLLTTTPHQWEDISALDRFNVHRCSTRWVFSGTGLKLVTRHATIRYLYHSATAATTWEQPRTRYGRARGDQKTLVGSKSLRKKRVQTRKVFQQCSHDLILRWDFFKATDDIDCGSDELLVGALQMNEVNSGLYADNDIVIQRNSIRKISALTKDHQTLEKNGKIDIRIANSSSQPQIIPADMCIAKMRDIEDGVRRNTLILNTRVQLQVDHLEQVFSNQLLDIGNGEVELHPNT
ncbi:uncharacterized protein TNCV_3248641 [Trichonephila clavipes]|nr:uncharacterized protein TNCV_3248641 [Trichonephila clavipes]